MPHQRRPLARVRGLDMADHDVIVAAAMDTVHATADRGGDVREDGPEGTTAVRDVSELRSSLRPTVIGKVQGEPFLIGGQYRKRESRRVADELEGAGVVCKTHAHERAGSCDTDVIELTVVA
jgi:hypothetical protein